MRLSLCNEVIRDLPFEQQCALAAALGYAGLEVAPFTLGEAAWTAPAGERAAWRRALADSGVAVSGLHWLLVSPAGLSITSGDKATWDRTVDILRRLIDLCSELGGAYLVHGSPAQRRVGDQADPAAAAARGEAAWAAIADDARRAGVVYCIEPLSRPEADFVNTLGEAAAIVQRIGSPALRTMVDTLAAASMEPEPVADALRRWLPTGMVAHIQLNDRNRRGPGQGDDRFAPVLRALKDGGYGGWVAMEPFDYHPDGPTCAARAIGYVQGILETLA
ncbi:sugar phosphate isomerase/epimerase family protein [Vineibacter terrae]|uniref:sugar phosphate isomerase/epimerase family protein n=1 Tax=Vineibacter terrae TaxID=2586908 RepID=UPI002E33927E|nr:sugar phosphate isomerase/epimerase family protein [Vineibacter terrae]HEX2890803.1 sugar phosphate isomerase/epimerase family protein [Vineibacter terrae]